MERRALLAGAAVLVAGAGAAGYATEGPRVRRLLNLEPSSPHAVPNDEPGEVLSGSFGSAAMRAPTGWSLALPPGRRRPMPVLVTLHGRSGSHRDAFEANQYHRFLAAVVATGTPPFAIASVDGGDHSYFHARTDGTDPERMITDELLPMLAARGLRTERFGLHGVSMGGYGALLLAQRLGRQRVVVVAADAPAIWQRWEDSAPGAFDGPADFAAHNVLKSHAVLTGLPTRITVGSDDPFRPGVRELLRRLPAAESHTASGAHNAAWWKHAAPGQLAFVGRHLRL